MSVFQIILLIFFGLGLVAAAVMTARRIVPLRVGIVLILIAAIASVLTIVPDTTTDIAKALGIGRGKDLILYCTVVAMMTGFVMIYVRLRHVRRELTLLVRQIAIEEASRNVKAGRMTQGGTGSPSGPVSDHDNGDNG